MFVRYIELNLDRSLDKSTRKQQTHRYYYSVQKFTRMEFYYFLKYIGGSDSFFKNEWKKTFVLARVFFSEITSPWYVIEFLISVLSLEERNENSVQRNQGEMFGWTSEIGYCESVVFVFCVHFCIQLSIEPVPKRQELCH